MKTAKQEERIANQYRPQLPLFLPDPPISPAAREAKWLLAQYHSRKIRRMLEKKQYG